MNPSPDPRPLLLLDVDGPLNPYYADAGERPAAYRAHRTEPGWARGPVEIWLDRAHGPKLRGLPYELVWASTWQACANTWIAPVLGLPPLPHVELPGPAEWRPDDTCPKTWPIVSWVAGRPFAWVDDDIGETDRAYVAAHHAGPALLHRVHPGRGLVDADFAVLAAWAEGLRGGSRA
ncbi:hypothetical protein [Kitasatospora sp. NPDC092286]|uniref:hypothetical protein n=1 Tax=Kitasatospora sp. NPDC092286 TaxID=3364087 RepID=UPI0037F1B7AD